MISVVHVMTMIYHLCSLVKIFNKKGHQEYTSLLSQHVAAAKGFDDIAQFLIEKGASVNVKGKSLVIWHYKDIIFGSERELILCQYTFR